MKKKIDKIIQLLNWIQKNLFIKNVSHPGNHILVSISGGQDSISLLFILFHLQIQWNWTLRYIWCNHLWHRLSFDTMYHLWKLSYFLRNPFIFCISIENSFSEEKARKWREKIFSRLTLFYKSDTLLTGHTGSDAIETVLFNLFRGTSTDGINSLKEIRPIQFQTIHFQSITIDIFNQCLSNQNRCFDAQKNWSNFRSQYILKRNFFDLFDWYCLESKTNQIHFPRKIFYFQTRKNTQIHIIRPLLMVTRYDSKQLIKYFRFPIYPDPSNHDLNYTRNHIRNQFLPFVRFFYNPQADTQLLSFTHNLLDETVYFQSIIHRLFSQKQDLTDQQIEINISVLYFLPRVIRKKYIRYVLKFFFNVSPHFYHIDFLSKVIENKNFENHILNKYSLCLEQKSKYLFFPKIGCLVIQRNRVIFYK